MISPSRDVRGHAVVIADDDRDALRWTRELIQSQGLRAICASSRDALLECLECHQPSAIVLDYDLDGDEGIDVLQETRRRAGGAPVIVVSRTHSIRQAVSVMQGGAVEYLTKPLKVEDLLNAVDHAMHNPTQVDLSSNRDKHPVIRQILGRSHAIASVRQLIHEVAKTDATALVIGESGTGKELVARAIHDESLRSQNSFVPVNMAALPSGLVESVLFGHVKGAFTGADVEQAGCCAMADEGTLFLDEISEMDVSLQAKLLRFLQDQTFQRVGSSTLQKVDVRIVAAANQNPFDLVRRGQLREDLFYRLNVFPIEIPPLRHRLEDVPTLAEHFLHVAALDYGKSDLAFTADAMQALREFTWPGNVRQLENVVQRIVIRSRGQVIDIDQIPQEIVVNQPLEAATSSDSPVSSRLGRDESANLSAIESLEKKAIVEALAQSGGKVVSAARILGLGQATVYRKIKRYKIHLDHARRGSQSSERRRA